MTHDISPELISQTQYQLHHPELQKTLLEQLDVSDSALQVVGTNIHPMCQMLAHSLRAHQDASLSVSQYFGIALQQYRCAVEVIRRLERDCPEPKILDFACGYGRLLNLLIHSVPSERIWASEIQADAVSFAVENFGVQGLQSSARPEDFDPGEQFDLIWVVSLFSHLPPGLFERWIKRLSELLSPQGVLMFSVHDQVLLPSDMAMPESGVLFLNRSENADLSTDLYGTTFVTEDYVREAITSTLGDQRSFLRLPRMINYEQDAYLIGGTEVRDLSPFSTVRHGPRGWLDSIHITEDGTLHLAGWAASMDSSIGNEDPIDLEISLDNERQACNTGEPSPAVATVLGNPSLGHCGWSAEIPLPSDQAETYLRIIARGSHNQRALIYAGALAIPKHNRRKADA